jgi:hypothetical protein
MIAHAGQATTGLSLLFARGRRPGAADIVALARQRPPGAAACDFAVSHVPPPEEGWLELLIGGLTFDLAGLLPAGPARTPARRHVFGFDGPELPDDLEAVWLGPSVHLAGGAALLPVVRATMAIAASLARLPGLRAVCWHPADLWSETALFVRMAGTWLDGGAFPALGLTALIRDADDSLRSDGLAFFTGQELWLEPDAEKTPAEAAKLAVHFIHRLVEGGAIHSARELIAPNGARLAAEPSPDRRLLRIWRRP